jgi:hypothetical protein
MPISCSSAAISSFSTNSAMVSVPTAAATSRKHRTCREVERIVEEIADELAVDLQVVDLQRLQVVEARGAGAEVVEREADAVLAHGLDERGRVGHVRDGRGLGHLEAQLAVIEVRAVDDLAPPGAGTPDR